MTCAVDGCSEPVYSKKNGLCHVHWHAEKKARREGQPFLASGPPVAVTPKMVRKRRPRGAEPLAGFLNVPGVWLEDRRINKPICEDSINRFWLDEATHTTEEPDMPKKTVTSLFDDLDGNELPEDTAPVHLSMGRTTYALYLSEDNHGKLLKALDPFIKNAETVVLSNSTRKSTSAASTSLASGLSDDDKKSVRHWAIDTKFKFTNPAGEEKTLADRGRIPDAVVKGWQDAGSPGIGA